MSVTYVNVMHLCNEIALYLWQVNVQTEMQNGVCIQITDTEQ